MVTNASGIALGREPGGGLVVMPGKELLDCEHITAASFFKR
jgi:hypothetical protein